MILSEKGNPVKYYSLRYLVSLELNNTFLKDYERVLFSNGMILKVFHRSNSGDVHLHDVRNTNDEPNEIAVHRTRLSTPSKRSRFNEFLKERYLRQSQVRRCRRT